MEGWCVLVLGKKKENLRPAYAVCGGSNAGAADQFVYKPHYGYSMER